VAAKDFNTPLTDFLDLEWHRSPIGLKIYSDCFQLHPDWSLKFIGIQPTRGDTKGSLNEGLEPYDCHQNKIGFIFCGFTQDFTAVIDVERVN
jgi:hypothetical protein